MWLTKDRTQPGGVKKGNYGRNGWALGARLARAGRRGAQRAI